MGLFSYHLNIPGYILGEVGQREQCLDSHVDCGVPCCQARSVPGPCWQAVISVLRHSWVTRGKAWPTDHLEAADDVKKIHIRYRDGGHTNSNKSDHNGWTPNTQILDSNKYSASKATQKKCQLYDEKKKIKQIFILIFKLHLENLKWTMLSSQGNKTDCGLEWHATVYLEMTLLLISVPILLFG